MAKANDDQPLPPYAYVPGGPWPHPISSPAGHSYGHRHPIVPPIKGDAWDASPMFGRGVALFNAGYYWEAHEAWEYLWHSHGRKGPQADMLKGLIKLAAAGVKAREGQAHGVSVHAGRAATIFRALRETEGPRIFGLDLEELASLAQGLAEQPDLDPGPRSSSVVRVIQERLKPSGKA